MIREDPTPALVIQGGPGTGKTAVGLHRAAWLLYANPALAREGVLIVGPNRTFIRYIGQVLPSLGEQSVEQREIDALISRPAPRDLREPRARDAEGQRAHGGRARAPALEPAPGARGARSSSGSGTAARGSGADDVIALQAAARERTRTYQARARCASATRSPSSSPQRRAPDRARRAAVERGHHQRGPQELRVPEARRTGSGRGSRRTGSSASSSRTAGG